MIFLEFIVIAFIVVYCAMKLSEKIEVIEANSKMNVIIAGAILAAATSLPELATGITSTLLGQPEMTVSNVLGSNIFNLLILAMAHIIFAKDIIYHKIHRDTNNLNLYVLGMYIVLLVGFYLSTMYSLTIGHLSIITPVLFFIYLFGMRAVSKVDLHSENFEEENIDVSQLKKAIFHFVLFAILVLFASILLSKIAEQIMLQSGLDASFVGAIFIGITTSLPELISCFALMKAKQYDMAAVGIIGSCMFNITILFVVDIISDTPIIVATSGLYVLSILGIIFLILTYCATRFKFKYHTIIPSIICLVYMCYLFFGG